MRLRAPSPRALALAIAAALALPAAATAVQIDEPAPPPGPPERAIVVWEPGTSGVERVEARTDADATLVRTLGDSSFQLVAPQAGQSLDELLTGLRADPAVRVAARDRYSRVSATTNDSFFGQLWGLHNTGAGVAGFGGALAGADIGATAAWDRTRGTASTLVAIIDAGHRLDHPDLGPVTWVNPADPQNGLDDDGNGLVDDTRGADFVGTDIDVPRADGDPTDDDAVDGGHGVHVAGTAAAAGNDGVGVSGVAQGVRIMPLRVCGYSSSENSGGLCPESAQIQAINYAGAHGARVANLSLGGPGSNPAVQAAYAANPHVLHVVAAGNGGGDGIGDDNDARPQYPCAYPVANIVCVAATNQADQLAGFSNFGDVTVDLGAPGTETLSSYPDFDETTTLFSESFQGGDFATRWGPSGAGFQTSAEAPLTSTGITDTPGGPPVAGQLYQVELRSGIAIPAGVDACRLGGRRFVRRGAGGSVRYSLLVGSVNYEFTPSDTAGSAVVPFASSLVPVDAGQSLRLRFRYVGPTTPAAGDGVWLDDLVVTCNSALSAPPAYAFLQGTSMASPHVAGAAALLFSLKPTATVAQVRSALLSTVDPLPALAGKTVTGGRLDVARALDALVPLPSTPPAPPVAPPAPPPPPAATTPPVVRAAAPRCVVPRLRGLSLRRARAALSRARCRLGGVTRPRARHGRRLPPLVVRASTPRAGAVRAEDARVAVTLAPKRSRASRRRRSAR